MRDDELGIAGDTSVVEWTTRQSKKDCKEEYIPTYTVVHRSSLFATKEKTFLVCVHS